MSHPVTKTTPIDVRVVNHPEPANYEVRSAFRSAVLTATNPSIQIAGYDPLRKCIWLSPAVNAYVIAGSIGQAQDPNNLAASIAQPNGRYVPANVPETIVEGQNEVWIATGTYPTVVGYEIVRKVPQ